MKKILFITTISGFLQQFEMNDVAILQEAGYEIHYASNFNNPVYEVNKEVLEQMGIKLHHIEVAKSPIRIIENFKAYKETRRIMKEEGINAVHCHNPMGGVVGRLAAMKLKCNVFVIYTAHGFHFYKGAPLLNWLLYYPAEWFLAHCTNRLITINEEDFKRASSFKLRKGGYVRKIPGVGVDIKKFSPVEGRRQKMREELHIKEDSFYLLSVGELNDNKNHQVLIKALAKLKDENIYLGICGKGPMEQELKKLAEKLGVADKVSFYGFRKDIPHMLSVADVFCFPSKREGLGIAAIEAMAAGVPLITSDCRGTREYVEDGINGLICKNGSVDEYAKAIITLKNNNKLREDMSAACLMKAPRFDMSETDKIMRELYGDGKM